MLVRQKSNQVLHDQFSYADQLQCYTAGGVGVAEEQTVCYSCIC